MKQQITYSSLEKVEYEFTESDLLKAVKDHYKIRYEPPPSDVKFWTEEDEHGNYIFHVLYLFEEIKEHTDETHSDL